MIHGLGERVYALITDTVEVFFNLTYSLNLVIYNCFHPPKTSSNRKYKLSVNIWGRNKNHYIMANIKLTALIWFGLFLVLGYKAWFLTFLFGAQWRKKSTLNNIKKAILYRQPTGKINCKRNKPKNFMLYIIKQWFRQTLRA